MAASCFQTDGDASCAPAVHLMPDPAIHTDEAGTRHRTAERVAKQTGYPRDFGQPVDEHHRALRRRSPLCRSRLRDIAVSGKSGSGDFGPVQTSAR